jgi:hypothetical protein
MSKLHHSLSIESSQFDHQGIAPRPHDPVAVYNILMAPLHDERWFNNGFRIPSGATIRCVARPDGTGVRYRHEQ